MISLGRVGQKPIIPVFILSTGRAGTNWIVWAASHCTTNTICVHEAPPPIKGVGLAYYEHNITRKQAAEYCEAARGPAILAIRKWCKKTFYVEANQNMFSLKGPLSDVFPTARFVGLIRNGVAFVTSMINKGVYQNGYKYLEPCGSLATKWPEFTLVQKLAWHWKEKVGILVKEDIPIFKIEELWSYVDGFYAWCDFWKVVGVPQIATCTYYYNALLAKKVNRSKRNVFPSYPDWSQKDKDDFWAICGPLMHNLGYK